MNQTQQIIRLTKDPELKVTTNGKSVCSFSGAYNEKYNNEDHVSFYNYTAWGKTAEAISQYVKKGQRLCIISKAQQETWEDKDGNKRDNIKFIVQSFHFIELKSSNGEQKPMSKQAPDVWYQEEDQSPSPFSDSSIPF